MGQAEHGVHALEIIAGTQVDVVLMDVRMPVMNGIEATAVLKSRGGPPVLLLTTFEEVDDMVGGLNAGADGYLFKSAEIDEIVSALWQIHQGERVIHPKVAQILAQQIRSPLAPALSSTNSSLLTERELQVIKTIAAGHSNKRIAQLMGISEGTVKVHVSNILGKLDATNRTEAVLRAQEYGLLDDL